MPPIRLSVGTSARVWDEPARPVALVAADLPEAAAMPLKRARAIVRGYLREHGVLTERRRAASFPAQWEGSKWSFWADAITPVGGGEDKKSAAEAALLRQDVMNYACLRRRKV